MNRSRHADVIRAKRLSDQTGCRVQQRRQPLAQVQDRLVLPIVPALVEVAAAHRRRHTEGPDRELLLETGSLLTNARDSRSSSLKKRS